MDAYVIFRNGSLLTLDDLRDRLAARLGFAVSTHVWRGFGAEIPQIHVRTTPAVAIQLDEAAHVRDEICERDWDEITPDEASVICEFASRLEITSATPTNLRQLPDGSTMSWSEQIDPQTPEIRQVIATAEPAAVQPITDHRWQHWYEDKAIGVCVGSGKYDGFNYAEAVAAIAADLAAQDLGE